MASHRSLRTASLLTALALAGPAIGHAQGIDTLHVPLRTARMEINTFRAEYTDAINRQDAAAAANLFASDAVMIDANGMMHKGREAIQKSITADMPQWMNLRIQSDTVRIAGSTAWDVGTLESGGVGASPSRTSRYIAVLRRSMRDWRIVSAAVVPTMQAQKASSR
jgi:uncharacterized protein (TIGR02246 family)